MAATLLRHQSVNSRDIKFELEATLAAIAVEREASRREKQVSHPTDESRMIGRRKWKQLQQELIALESLYLRSTGAKFQRPEAPPLSEMHALEVFFESMHGRRWINFQGWLGRKATANTRGVAPFCSHPWCWAGVQCGIGTIEGLVLPGNQLQGVLPGAALGALSGLAVINLSNNEIEGALPPDLGTLRRLRSLNCAVSKLEGPIPDTLGLLTGLQELDLSFGRLSGRLSQSLGCCTRLNVLNLSQNQLSGTIPEELGELRALRELRVAHNSLHGVIPDTLGNLVRLRILAMSCNHLEGPLPRWLGQLTNLQRLQLDENHIHGAFPQSMKHLGDLEVLHLQRNRLSGKLPRWLGNLTSLRVINLSHNDLTGTIPVECGNLTRLVSLELGFNFITGPLPPVLGQLTRLLDFHVMEGQQSYSLPLRRGFRRDGHQRVFVDGPRLGLNNTTYPCSGSP